MFLLLILQLLLLFNSKKYLCDEIAGCNVRPVPTGGVTRNVANAEKKVLKRRKFLPAVRVNAL
jgi:hypothetical protein